MDTLHARSFVTVAAHRFQQAAAAAGQRWLFLGPKDRPYAFSAPNLAADGENALVSTKKDGSAYVPGRLNFQLFTCNGFQCVWFLQLGSEAETEAVLDWWRKKYEKSATCAVSTAVEALPQVRPSRCSS
jgi:hypothetical protein